MRCQQFQCTGQSIPSRPRGGGRRCKSRAITLPGQLSFRLGIELSFLSAACNLNWGIEFDWAFCLDSSVSSVTTCKWGPIKLPPSAVGRDPPWYFMCIFATFLRVYRHLSALARGIQHHIIRLRAARVGLEDADA